MKLCFIEIMSDFGVLTLAHVSLSLTYISGKTRTILIRKNIKDFLVVVLLFNDIHHTCFHKYHFCARLRSDWSIIFAWLPEISITISIISLTNSALRTKINQLTLLYFLIQN